MMKKIYTPVIMFLFAFPAIAQQPSAVKSEILSFEKSATVTVIEIKEDWSPQLQNLEMPTPGGNGYRDYLESLKAQMPEKKDIEMPLQKRKAPSPTIVSGYEGNLYHNRLPNDNTLAVSNTGDVISMINSSMNIYDANENLVQTISLAAFSDTLKIAGGKYDPRVVYDPKEDKFIACFLNGNTDSTSAIIMAFSKTGDPAGEWNLYEIPGNPLNDTSWSDFPMLALTDNEIFLTINLLRNGGSWQESFKQTLVWQINKNSGYTGSALQSTYYSGIKHNGNNVRNLCPVQGGYSTTGPDLYLISNRNFSVESDTFFFAHITGELGHPGTQFNMQIVKSDVKYGVPPNVEQPFNRTLQTNDARVLAAYIEGGEIQFVGNTAHPATAKGTIFHGTITNISGAPQISLQIISHPYYEFGYPSIAYAGATQGGKESVILVEFSSDTINPGNAVYYFDGYDYSDPVVLKEGEAFISIIGSPERWGDYSAIQRKYNEPGKFYTAATWGKKIPPTLGSATRVNATWIATVTTNAYVGISDKKKGAAAVKAYPVPAKEYVTLEFELEKAEFLTFTITDINGRAVKVLMRELAKSGRNQFTFNTAMLKPGIYMLQISGNKSFTHTQRIVVR